MLLLTTAQLSRGGLTEPGWEAPQGKHLLDTSVCLSVCLLRLLSVRPLLSAVYLVFLLQAVISAISLIV